MNPLLSLIQQITGVVTDTVLYYNTDLVFVFQDSFLKLVFLFCFISIETFQTELLNYTAVDGISKIESTCFLQTFFTYLHCPMQNTSPNWQIFRIMKIECSSIATQCKCISSELFRMFFFCSRSARLKTSGKKTTKKQIEKSFA